MQLKVIRNEDGEIFDIESYRVGSDGFFHIYCNEWKGHHRLGIDCEIYDPEMTYQEMYDEISQHKIFILKFMEEKSIVSLDLTEDTFYTPKGQKILYIYANGDVKLRGIPSLFPLYNVDAISTFRKIHDELETKESLIKFNYDN